MQRILMTLPTGAGKTIIFSKLAYELDQRTLIIAHRKELLPQAPETLLRVWPGPEISFVKAEQNDFTKPIVIASVQILAHPIRLEQLKSEDFGLCILDEYHHAGALSYKRILKQLGFMEDHPEKLLVGVTATPFRSNELSLGEVFQETVYELPIQR